MTISDRDKLERLKKRFELNFRITNMYAQYLERYPELITREMVDELCRDGDITPCEAVTALLAEIFALDDARGGDDRVLIREYLSRSVRVTDVTEYTDDKYYKSVVPKEARHGDWEIRWEYYPPYRAAICDDMIIKDDFTEIPPLGFFTEGFRFPAVLEHGNEWMTLTPVDTDTCKKAINDARGRVITFGLGLGYYAYMVSEKPEVDSITVVERSKDVINLFTEHVLPGFTHPEKVRIINADAFEYAEHEMPRERYNYAFVDTWRDASDGLPMYERMKALEHLSPDTEFSYWIEGFIKSRQRALRFAELNEMLEKRDTGAPKSYNEFIERLTE